MTSHSATLTSERGITPLTRPASHLPLGKEAPTVGTVPSLAPSRAHQQQHPPSHHPIPARSLHVADQATVTSTTSSHRQITPDHSRAGKAEPTEQSKAEQGRAGQDKQAHPGTVQATADPHQGTSRQQTPPRAPNPTQTQRHARETPGRQHITPNAAEGAMDGERAPRRTLPLSLPCSCLRHSYHWMPRVALARALAMGSGNRFRPGRGVFRAASRLFREPETRAAHAGGAGVLAQGLCVRVRVASEDSRFVSLARVAGWWGGEVSRDGRVVRAVWGGIFFASAAPYCFWLRCAGGAAVGRPGTSAPRWVRAWLEGQRGGGIRRGEIFCCFGEVISDWLRGVCISIGAWRLEGVRALGGGVQYAESVLLGFVEDLVLVWVVVSWDCVGGLSIGFAAEMEALSLRWAVRRVYCVWCVADRGEVWCSRGEVPWLKEVLT